MALAACSDDACESLGSGPAALCGARDVTLPVVAGFDLPVVAGSVEGRPALLLVDTGVAGSAIVSASLLGWPNGRSGTVDRLCLGGMCFDQVPVQAWDSPIVGMGDGAINGIVGVGVLRHVLLGLDRLDRLRLARAAAPCSGTEAALADGDSGRPWADLRVDGALALRALVDTGARWSVR